jgi:hypothetical protein
MIESVDTDLVNSDKNDLLIHSVLVWVTVKSLSNHKSQRRSTKVAVQNIGDKKTTGVVQVYAGKAGARQSAEELGPDACTEVQVQCRLDPISHWNGSSNQSDVDGGKYNAWMSHSEGYETEAEVVEVSTISWGINTKQN